MSKEKQLSLYSYYVEGIELNKAFESPFRTDNTPSFSIFEADNGNEILWMDHVFSEKPGDIFDLIQIMNNNCARHHAHKLYYKFLIDYELPQANPFHNLDDDKKTNKGKEKENQSKPTAKISSDFQSWELKYWLDRGITKQDLIDEDIYALRGYFWGDSTNNAAISSPHKPLFYYKITDPYNNNEAHKIYSPTEKGENKKDKWRSWDLSEVLLETYPQKKNKEAIICSSRKDMIQAKKICGDKFDYGSLKAESSIKPFIKWYERDGDHYDRVFYLGDFDFRRDGDDKGVKRGIERMEQVKEKSEGKIISLIPTEELKLTWHNLDVKDVDEMIVKFKINWTKFQIRQLFTPFY